MTAGRRNRKIVIQKAGAPVDDGYNTVPGGWADFATVFAEVRFSKGSERRAAAQEQASAAATFLVLETPAMQQVSVADRIVFDGANWDIVSAIPSQRLGRHREIDAVRALG